MSFTDTSFMGYLLLGYFGIYVLMAIPKSFFLMTLQKTLQAVRPENRKMKPGKVWLMMIPLFSYVWAFFVVDAVATSIKNELSDTQFSFEEADQNFYRRNNSGDDPTRNIGLAQAICYACFWIPFLGSLASIAGFICWIIYWVQADRYRTQLEQRRWTEEPRPEYSNSKDLF
ncbi:MAG: hypothetical protein EOP50_02190 [Sphingobacteriales bacterium]|nr:MAG: hypothetical protein EOP50_02190 [Sphingobacteriales bacterium]